MSVIIILIVISLIVALLFLAVFVWAVRSGQYDDTVSPSIRILFDDNKQKKSRKENDAKNQENKL
jgi:cbb3-type cytochrome oxidase maturation protein